MRFIFRFVKENKTLLIKYGIVGGLSAIIDFGVYILLTDLLDIFYIWATSTSFILAAFFNFSLNRKWTFQSKGQKRKQLPIFFSVALVGILLNNGVMALFIELFAFWDVLAKLIATATVTGWNFMANKYITFRKKDLPEDNINGGEVQDKNL